MNPERDQWNAKIIIRIPGMILFLSQRSPSYVHFFSNYSIHRVRGFGDSQLFGFQPAKFLDAAAEFCIFLFFFYFLFLVVFHCGSVIPVLCSLAQTGIGTERRSMRLYPSVPGTLDDVPSVFGGMGTERQADSYGVRCAREAKRQY